MEKRLFIGQRIKTMRLSRGMTQADLAKEIGQSASSITMYETGKRQPDFQTLEALADIFNVPLVSFVDNDGLASYLPGDKPLNPKIRNISTELSELTDDELEEIESLLLVAISNIKKRRKG